jgi:two-component sensor histidine kinase
MHALLGGDRDSWARAIVVAVATLALAYGLRLAVDPVIHGQLPFATFYPAVLAAALLGGRASGLLAAALAAPIALIAFGGVQWIGAAIVWLVTASAIALAGGSVRSLARSLRAERDAAEAARAQFELVAGELNHRARNTFAILSAVTSQSAQNAASVEDFRDRLLQRIQALTAGYSLLSSRAWNASLGLREIVCVALGPFRDAHADQLDIRDGAAFDLPPSIGVSMILCLHELATNAVKYGALSAEQGRVTCEWAETAPGVVQLRWRESGGPPVIPPANKGFGSRVIGGALRGAPGGKVDLRFPPGGVECDITFPAAQSAPSSPGPAASP